MLGQWGEDDCRVLLAGLHKYGPDFQLLALVLPYTEEEVCERGCQWFLTQVSDTRTV